MKKSLRCPKCKNQWQIDIPPTNAPQVKVRCPNCSATFALKLSTKSSGRAVTSKPLESPALPGNKVQPLASSPWTKPNFRDRNIEDSQKGSNRSWVQQNKGLIGVLVGVIAFLLMGAVGLFIVFRTSFNGTSTAKNPGPANQETKSAVNQFEKADTAPTESSPNESAANDDKPTETAQVINSKPMAKSQHVEFLKELDSMDVLNPESVRLPAIVFANKAKNLKAINSAQQNRERVRRNRVAQTIRRPKHHPIWSTAADPSTDEPYDIAPNFKLAIDETTPLLADMNGPMVVVPSLPEKEPVSKESPARRHWNKVTKANYKVGPPVSVVDLRTGEESGKLPGAVVFNEGRRLNCCLSPDGQYAVGRKYVKDENERWVLESAATIWKRSSKGSKKGRTINLNGVVGWISFISNKKFAVLIGAPQHQLMVFNAASGKRISSIPISGESVFHINRAPSQSQIERSKNQLLWLAEPNFAAVSPTGRYVAVVVKDGIALVSIEQKEVVGKISLGKLSGAPWIAFDRDGEHFSVCGTGGVSRYSVSDGSPTVSLNSRGSSVRPGRCFMMPGSELLIATAFPTRLPRASTTDARSAVIFDFESVNSLVKCERIAVWSKNAALCWGKLPADLQDETTDPAATYLFSTTAIHEQLTAKKELGENEPRLPLTIAKRADPADLTPPESWLPLPDVPTANIPWQENAAAIRALASNNLVDSKINGLKYVGRFKADSLQRFATKLDTYSKESGELTSSVAYHPQNQGRLWPSRETGLDHQHMLADYTADGTKVAITDFDLNRWRVDVFDIDGTHEIGFQPCTADEPIRWLKWNGQQKLLTLVEGTITGWNVETATAEFELPGSYRKPMRFFPRRKYLVASAGRHVDILDIDQGKVLARIGVNSDIPGKIDSIAISPDSKKLALTYVKAGSVIKPDPEFNVYQKSKVEFATLVICDLDSGKLTGRKIGQIANEKVPVQTLVAFRSPEHLFFWQPFVGHLIDLKFNAVTNSSYLGYRERNMKLVLSPEGDLWQKGSGYKRISFPNPEFKEMPILSSPDREFMTIEQVPIQVSVKSVDPGLAARLQKNFTSQLMERGYHIGPDGLTLQVNGSWGTHGKLRVRVSMANANKPVDMAMPVINYVWKLMDKNGNMIGEPKKSKQSPLIGFEQRKFDVQTESEVLKVLIEEMKASEIETQVRWNMFPKKFMSSGDKLVVLRKL